MVDGQMEPIFVLSSTQCFRMAENKHLKHCQFDKFEPLHIETMKDILYQPPAVVQVKPQLAYVTQAHARTNKRSWHSRMQQNTSNSPGMTQLVSQTAQPWVTLDLVVDQLSSTGKVSAATLQNTEFQFQDCPTAYTANWRVWNSILTY